LLPASCYSHAAAPRLLPPCRRTPHEGTNRSTEALRVSFARTGRANRVDSTFSVRLREQRPAGQEGDLEHRACILGPQLDKMGRGAALGLGWETKTIRNWAELIVQVGSSLYFSFSHIQTCIYIIYMNFFAKKFMYSTEYQRLILEKHKYIKNTNCSNKYTQFLIVFFPNLLDSE